jgi:hypothetical protein
MLWLQDLLVLQLVLVNQPHWLIRNLLAQMCQMLKPRRQILLLALLCHCQILRLLVR